MKDYQVTITAPGGETRDVRIPENQVAYMAKGQSPFMFAAYLAYCDLYVREVQGEESEGVQPPSAA